MDRCAEPQRAPGHDRADLTLRLRYAPEAVQHVRNLMRQEQACCAFLSFEMHEQPDVR